MLNTVKELMLRELDAWDGATSEARRATALTVADTLPDGFEFTGLESYTLGGQTHEIASFQYDEAEFLLLPGRSRADLGFDRSQSLEMTPEQAADWKNTSTAHGISLDEYLDRYLSPLRQVMIAPLLVEAIATAHEYGQDGSDQAEGYSTILAACGDFRLPTADEWEYACAADARSLFRWGNYWPSANSAKEKTWRLHEVPNAFGLLMNSSTYDSELCQGPKIRGGDGGASVCGGMGHFASWLPLASSFQVPDDEVELVDR